VGIEHSPLPCVRVHVGTAGIITRRVRDLTQILMGQRCGKHGPGTWSLPGGWMEHGETPEEAVVREIAEETDLVVGVVRGVYSVRQYRIPYTNTIFKSGVQSLTLFFVIDEWVGTPRVMEPDKCKEWRWFDVDKLPEPLFDPLILSGVVRGLEEDERIERAPG